MAQPPHRASDSSGSASASAQASNRASDTGRYAEPMAQPQALSASRLRLLRVMLTLVVAVMASGSVWFVLTPESVQAANSVNGAKQVPGPHVIELFTSHGCSSCPAADAYLGEILSTRDDVIALEFHVDYWNSLVHGSSGNFVDPFSAPEWTERQQLYRTRSLQGREGVYTPQMIINGEYAAVGSDRRRVRKRLQNTPTYPLHVSVQPSAEAIEVTGELEGEASVWLVHYWKERVTAVDGGENKGREITNHHVVTTMQHIAEVGGGPLPVNETFAIAAPTNPEQGCLIIVQRRPLSAVLGAAVCPS